MTTSVKPSKSPVSQSLVDNPRCADWFDLSRDGVVLIRTAKVEIGQGISSALVQIAAEELDVAPKRFDVLAGDTARGPLEGPTSSSLSIEVTGSAIRMAASAVRHVLLAEAAKLLQASPSELSIADGRVSAAGRDTDLTLWTLARTCPLDVPVVDHAAPKAAGERRLVGTPMPRLDLRAKAVQPAFIHDLVFDGMLHGRCVCPPSIHRRVAAFDAAGLAAKFPDVTIVRDGSFIGLLAEREDRAAAAIAVAESLVTWSEDASSAGDPVRAVAASTAAPEVIVATDNDRSASNVASQTKGITVSTTITKPFTAHASIAPSCAIAQWRGDDSLEVHCHSQGVHSVRDGLATAFGMAAEKIVVRHAPGAGTYGHSGQDDVAMDAALLAKAAAGRPVRVLWTRAADFIGSPLGPAMSVAASMTVGADGRIAAYEIESRSQPHVRRPGRGGAVGMVSAELRDPPAPSVVPDDVPIARGGGAERNALPLYRIPRVHVAKRIVKDLPWRTSALRGLGAYANVYAVETLVDDAARAIDADPVRFRLDHLDDARAQGVIQRAAEMAGWPGPTDEGEGLGLAFAQYKNRSAYCAVVVRVRLDETVRVTDAWAAVDAGEAINPDGIRNQIEGGIVQSISWTLKEAVAVDGDAITVRDWEDYPILRFSEVPAIHVEVVDHKELPSLGVGEAATGPTAAAISNAVLAAVGVRVRDLPITRDAVIAATR